MKVVGMYLFSDILKHSHRRSEAENLLSIYKLFNDDGDTILIVYISRYRN